MKDLLIRLGSQNPDLRKHISPVLSHLNKTAGEYDFLKTDLKRGGLDPSAFEFHEPRGEKAGWKFQSRTKGPIELVVHIEEMSRKIIYIVALNGTQVHNGDANTVIGAAEEVWDFLKKLSNVVEGPLA